MIVKKSLLLNALKNAMPGVESGNVVLEGSDTFIFHKGYIFTYNDIISVMVPIEQSGLIEEDLEGAVKADEFYRVISKFSTEEIKFEVSDKNSWIIKSGKARAELTLLDFNYETRLKGISPNEENWLEIDSSFVDGLSLCKMLDNKSIASGVYVKEKNIYSTDGWRLNKYNIKTEKDFPAFGISDSSINELSKLINIKKIQLQDNWVHFATEDGTIFSIKTLQNEKFPYEKVEKLLSVTSLKEDDIQGTFPSTLFTVIDRAIAFSFDINEHSAVKLLISKDKIEVSANRSSGSYVEDVEWEEPFTKDFEPIVVYVDTNVINYMAKKSLNFYLQKGAKKGNGYIPRMIFVTDNSVHMMSTLEG